MQQPDAPLHWQLCGPHAGLRYARAEGAGYAQACLLQPVIPGEDRRSICTTCGLLYLMQTPSICVQRELAMLARVCRDLAPPGGTLSGLPLLSSLHVELLAAGPDSQPLLQGLLSALMHPVAAYMRAWALGDLQGLLLHEHGLVRDMPGMGAACLQVWMTWSCVLWPLLLCGLCCPGRWHPAAHWGLQRLGCGCIWRLLQPDRLGRLLAGSPALALHLHVHPTYAMATRWACPWLVSPALAGLLAGRMPHAALVPWCCQPVLKAQHVMSRTRARLQPCPPFCSPCSSYGCWQGSTCACSCSMEALIATCS